MNEQLEPISPYLLDGVSPEETEEVSRSQVPLEAQAEIASRFPQEWTAVLYAGAWWEHRLRSLWTEPINDEERRIAHLFRLGAPLNLDPFFYTMWRMSQREPDREMEADSIPPEELVVLVPELETQEAEDRRIGGVTPCLYHLGQGEYRLGTEDELGPIFSGPSPGVAVNQAVDWMRQALAEQTAEAR